MGSELVKPDHLDRKAVVYVRQSTQHQVITNQESLKLQYALSRRARELGWREADIDVIDSDLGQSGAGAAHRKGFKDLVARVTLGEIGLVLSIDVTRLARNCSDWYPLLDVCGHRRCLIADRDGIYDPGTPNGRLLLGLKGTISELELHTIRSRMTAGLLAKAERGDLALQLPAGLVRDPSGVATKDPNIEVQERLLLLFKTFLKVRTAAQAMRVFVDRGLALPRRDRNGDLRWRPATVSAVTAILKNPAYAGAFVYGRTWQKPSQIPGERPHKSPRRRTDWRIVVRDKYPGYIDWETYEKIQAMLRDNRAEYQHIKSRGIPRDGAALLHGITYCGECGHKMAVRYKGGSQYVCNQLKVQRGVPECQNLRAAPIDAQVAVAFLEAVAPAEVDALSKASKSQLQSERALRDAEEQQIERLRYQAALAERQFNRADPDNRLVTGELERRWETALLDLRRAEEALAQRKIHKVSEPLGVPYDLRAKVIALGNHLPTLWENPATRRDHRKALLRCLIDKVVIRRCTRDKAEVRIVWRGGATTELLVLLPVNAVAALPRYREMIARIFAMAQEGLHDEEIARILTQEGHRSPSETDKVLPVTVQRIRLKHRLKSKLRQTRWPVVAGNLTVTQLATRLGIPAKWVYVQLRRGRILTTREASGRFLFPDKKSALEAIRKLRNHRVAKINLREDHHEK
jgi:DNA invertase Pin-like site-specific DNA recombinase